MEKSEKNNVLELGEALVKRFEKSGCDDSISRWMLHYVAELIEKTKIENTLGTEKDKRQCFESILQLWERRRDYPKGIIPFEEYATILTVLERLSEDGSQSFYRRNDELLSKLENEPEEIKSNLETILAIDKISKSLIKDLLAESLERVQNQDTKSLIEAAVNIDSNSIDLEVIFEFQKLTDEVEVTEKEILEKEIKTKKGNLELLRDLHDSYESQISKLEGKLHL